MKIRMSRHLVVGLVALVGVAGCGDDGETIRASGPEVDSSTTVTEAPSPGEPQQDDTADSATGSGGSGSGGSELQTTVPTRSATSTPTVAKALQPPPAPAGGSGIVGVVNLGPSCPAEKDGEPCPEQPAANATIKAQEGAASSSGRVTPEGPVIATTTANAAGQFRLDLPAGEYVLSAAATGAMSCDLTSVSVRDNSYASVRILCDNGMR